MTQPIKKFQAGLIKAAIFEREVQGQNGAFKSQSVALQTSYKKDGEWVNKSLTIVKKNLANTIQVLQQVAEYLENPLEEVPI